VPFLPPFIDLLLRMMHFSLVLLILASNRAFFYTFIDLSPRIVCFLLVYFLSFEIIDWPFNFYITLRLCSHLERRFRYFFLLSTTPFFLQCSPPPFNFVNLLCAFYPPILMPHAPSLVSVILRRAAGLG
jgi:hypothetical protein